jgi:hypothetical protein
MYIGPFISVVLLIIIYAIYNQNKQNNYLNNKALEQNAEIIKINIICQRLLSISKIHNEIIYIKKNYIYISVFILINNIILLTGLIIICYFSLFQFDDDDTKEQIIKIITFILFITFAIIIIIIYINNIYFNENRKVIIMKDNEIKIKKEEINNIYFNKLLKIIYDNEEEINNSIDEYISNYNYLNNIIIDKQDLINKLNKFNNKIIITVI